jgi:hypothetical protein
MVVRGLMKFEGPGMISFVSRSLITLAVCCMLMISCKLPSHLDSPFGFLPYLSHCHT